MRVVFHELQVLFDVRVEEEPITSPLSPISPLIPINQPPLGKKTHMASARFGKRAPARHPSIFIYDLKVEAEGDDAALPQGHVYGMSTFGGERGGLMLSMLTQKGRLRGDRIG